MRAADAYMTTFWLGLVGYIVLACSLLVARPVDVLVAAALWTVVVSLVLPWLYICVMYRRLRLPAWTKLFRGPHQ